MAESYPETNVVSPMDDADEEGGEQVAFKRGASVVDRYYSHYFKTDCGKQPGADQFVFFHANRLSVVGLAASHAAFTKCGGVKSLRFRDEVKASKVQGKQKRGALLAQSGTPLANIECVDGTKFIAHCNSRGHVLEVNLDLETDVTQLNTRPEAEGWLAILRPKIEELDRLKGELRTKEDFLQIVASRAKPASSSSSSSSE